MKPIKLRAAACAAVAAFLVVGCAGSDATNEAATPATGDTSSVEPTTAGPEILQFTNALVGGGELDASTLAGKPTAFWFWAPN